MISVIVPMRTIPTEFAKFRERVNTVTLPVEVIYVVNKGLERSISQLNNREHVVGYQRIGRGHAMIQGAQQAKGDTILFLHADTLLPEQWDSIIVKALSDISVVGGGFRLRFDRDNAYLRFLVALSTMVFHGTGELWGDRAMFIRSDALRQCLTAMDVPIMEDVQLSHCMKRRGRVILLDAEVRTASDAFHRRGMLRHTIRILLCRSMYTLGFSLELIWHCYYGKRTDG